jgi:hypothetical protein
LDFSRKYHVSLDWLVGGDLKGLQRMKHMRLERMKQEAKPAPTAQRIMEKYSKLNEKGQRFIIDLVDKLIASPDVAS